MSDQQQLVTIEIDDISLQAERGVPLIDVADAAGITIPRFCYHKKLSVAANCRMCLVEVEKVPKPLPACATPVNDGMRVYTHSPMVLAAQKAVMEFLLINHPLDCPICDQGGECELQDVSVGFGAGTSRFQERKRVVRNKDLGPLIATDMNRCIHCTRCVRFGEEIAGQREMGLTGRGENARIGTFIEKTLTSELSGNIIDLCPVGALTSKPFRYRARTWEMQQFPGIAPHDATGSNLYLHVKDNQVMRVVPRENDAVNEVWISDRDRFSYEGLYSKDRLEVPMIKKDGQWRSTDWETALIAVAQGLQRTVKSNGPNAIGTLASPGATLEELYLLQKAMRGLGCHNIDHRLDAEDFRDQDQAPPFPWLGQSLTDLENADVVLLIGSNCRKEQPLINHRIRQAALRGAQIFVLNPIDYPFNYPLAERLIASPEEMIARLAGIARTLTSEDSTAANSKTSPGTASEGTIAEALRTGARSTVLVGSLAQTHPRAAILRALAAHIADASDSTLGMLTAGANGTGAWIAGALPHRGPAGGTSETGGLDASAMLTQDCNSYVLLGVEPELDCANSHLATKALNNADFVVSFTAYRTRSMEEYADVLLPIALFAENAGTFVNAAGSWQTFTAAVTPPGETRPAWKILRVLGNLLNLDGFDYLDVVEIRDELQTLVRDRGASEKKGRWGAEEIKAQMAGKTSNQPPLTRIGDVPIHALDPLVRRAANLQRTSDAAQGIIRLNSKLAKLLGIEEGKPVSAVQDDCTKTLPVAIDERVPDQCVWLSAGIPESIGLGARFGSIVISPQ
uniref:NADH-quinone oxidoreductase n=1 Tax=Candidatus Kentrum sp. FM TaxID=2126340 RepID=A0A450VPV8_9GAMM|nr:MAG: NADH-quinone oxidoreductase subunit G [Candidatus Kentron sp. FM]VFJ45630.1 MAG: NADH-quinone oxidoreductase subunit G [Candidatus Kentron sp. FM]VFK06798.1 MAG: NADH-quinone oxidoreductase subunit G [Candidatus Kentron sp. FM]